MAAPLRLFRAVSKLMGAVRAPPSLMMRCGWASLNNKQLLTSLCLQPVVSSVSLGAPCTSQHHVLTSHRYTSNYCKSDGDEPDRLYKTIDIEVKGHDLAVINSYEKYVTMAARELDVTIGSVTTPPRVINRHTLLKSAHVHRKHMVQYEMRTLFRTIQVKRVTGSTADTFLEYIQRNLPEGMAMKVTRHAIQSVPDHIRRPSSHVRYQPPTLPPSLPPSQPQ